MKGNRVIIGAGIAVLFVACVLLRQFSPLIDDVVFLIIITLAGIEMQRAVANKYAPPMIGVVAVFPVVSLGAYIGGTYLELETPFLNGLMMVLIAVVVMIGITGIVTLASKNYTKEHFMSTLLVMLYPITLAVFFYAVTHLGLRGGAFEPKSGTDPFGATPLALLFAVSALSDTMAFCFGKLFKGPKLAPKISPKKTISGAIGGLVGGVMGAAAVIGISTANWMGITALPFVTNAGTFALHAFLIGILGSVCTQGGDLIASVVKRNVEIKDYGKLLGNHGGVMDRIDGQLFNAFFIFVYFTIASMF